MQYYLVQGTSYCKVLFKNNFATLKGDWIVLVKREVLS